VICSLEGAVRATRRAGDVLASLVRRVEIGAAHESHAGMPARESSEAMDRSGREPVLGSRAGALRVRLVKGPADAAEPFVVLHDGRFSRIHLAEIVTSTGEVVRRFALKMQSDGHARTKVHGRVLTNVDRDEMWTRERVGYDAASGPGVVARVPVPPELLESPPITYCAKVDRTFHPVCAETGDVLTVCRDDELLAGLGLLPYSQDAWRYLHAGSAQRPSRTFYRVTGANAERPRDGVQVRIGNQLFRDWARLVHAPADDAVAQRAAAVLPCITCEHRLACHPSPAPNGRVPAEDHLHAVSFHDVRAIALELQQFDYDELCVLLGGGELADVLAEPRSAARQALLQEHETALAAPGQWLFGRDPEQFPREVLRQKLAAFVAVCEGLREVHTKLDRPHFAVAPSNVLARLVPSGRGPVRWGFDTRLADLGSPLSFAPPANGGSRPTDGLLDGMLEPGPELLEDLAMRPFVAAELRTQESQSLAMAIAIRQAATNDPGGAMRLSIEGQGGLPKHVRAGDVVGVAATAGGDETTLWARVDEVRARGFVAAATVDRAHPFARLVGKKLDARLSFHRRFGSPVDLYGLGMLLFRTLLVNDDQSTEEVAEAVAKCLRRLDDELSPDGVDQRQVEARLLQMTTGKDLRARFEAANVLHRREAREQFAASVAAGRPPIDAATWQALLSIAFKLTTRWPGFSYATNLGDASPFLLKQVVTDVEAVRQRAWVQMFAGQECAAAIGAVCNAMLEQLRGELMAQPAEAAMEATSVGAATKGFRLVVQRENDSATQEYTFDREQVTIGRREVDNLVRLNDPMVSSAHAIIELQPEGWVVIDRNSTNGTEVDGIRLPGEVPQPVQDGTVIMIRPFRLTFHAGSANLDRTSVVQTISTDRLLDQLLDEFARCVDAPEPQQHDALRKVLQAARSAIGGQELHARLEEIGRKVRTPCAADEPAQGQAKFFAAAHRSLSQLSRTLLGPGEFQTVEDVQAFAARLAKFVETTSGWIERTLELRRALGVHLEVSATSSSGGRNGARSAADIRQLALGWAAAAPGDPTGAFLGKFFDDVAAIMEGLLKGSQQVRRAVRERLDPQRLVDQATAESVALLVKAAANSALWKLYVQTFQEVTEGKQFELELDRLLQKSLQERISGR